MDKKKRQYLGMFAAIGGYYIIHEGAHLIYALCTGVFKKINFMGMGIQIDVYAERMTESQLGAFCLVGALATAVAAYALVALIGVIVRTKSKTLNACMYYITLAMLILDPLYLSLLCDLVGGGDMNGIALLVPKLIARIIYGVLLVVNTLIFFRIVLPGYTKVFAENEK